MALPLWALKALPYVGAVLLVGGAVWYIDHRGYSRAEAEAEARETQRKLDMAEFERILGLKVGEIEDSMQTAINDSDTRIVNTLNGLEVTNRTVIQPTLVKEIQSEERFTDPATGITDGMLRELNRARGFSEQRPCPAGSNAVACFALPDPEPASGPDTGNSGN